MRELVRGFTANVSVVALGVFALLALSGGAAFARSPAR
jgi:hypothetical protein